MEDIIESKPATATYYSNNKEKINKRAKELKENPVIKNIARTKFIKKLNDGDYKRVPWNKVALHNIVFDVDTKKFN